MPGASHQPGSFHAALADFYAPGLDAATYVDRAFALTSRMVSFALNCHGAIDRRTGALAANFDDTPPGFADAFVAFGRLMGKYEAFRFDPATNGGPCSARSTSRGKSTPRRSPCRAARSRSSSPRDSLV